MRVVNNSLSGAAFGWVDGKERELDGWELSMHGEEAYRLET
jgi:hypothetical protein